MILRFFGSPLYGAATVTVEKSIHASHTEILTGSNGEDFHLSSHSAQDLGRYDFIKDICRLEEITSTLGNCEGWAIMLTNDTANWKIPQNNGTVDAAIRITEGRTLNGQLAWTDAASAGTKENSESDLPILGNYKLGWCDYSTTDSPSYGKFRFLAVNVRSISDIE